MLDEVEIGMELEDRYRERLVEGWVERLATFGPGEWEAVARAVAGDQEATLRALGLLQDEPREPRR